MRFLLGLLFAFSVAAVVGLGATFLVLTRGTAFGAVTIGAWTAWPKTGTSDIDPYARALIARTGELPIGSGDGIAFFARFDDSGRALDGQCDVTISGSTPQARFWTIALYDTQGRLVANVLRRQGFTSQEVVRRPDGGFEIKISPRALAGNWLPSGGVEQYILVLRLYDSPAGLASRARREAPMPSVVLGDCT